MLYMQRERSIVREKRVQISENQNIEKIYKQDYRMYISNTLSRYKAYTRKIRWDRNKRNCSVVIPLEGSKQTGLLCGNPFADRASSRGEVYRVTASHILFDIS